MALTYLALAAGTTSCIELSVDAKALASIEFSAPSSPSVVLGDTLRDTLGLREPLKARIFAADGSEITGTDISYVSTDTFVNVVSGGYIFAKKGPGTAKVFAIAGGLQSSVRNIEVIVRPDSLAPNGSGVDTVRLRAPTTGTTVDSSLALSFTVRKGATPVNAVRVTFQLFRRGVALARGDTAVYALVTSSGRVSTVDTTDASGVVSRNLRVRITAGTSINDSLEVRADAVLGGTPLKGAPAKRTVYVFPAQ
jgi:hypothetical protein